MNPRIIFEDDNILILDKPAGWITNEASTTVGQPVLQTWLHNNFDYVIAKDKRFRSGIVHRLDKETSGVLAVAKTKEAFENLQSQFKKRIVDKKYTALAHGKIDFEKGSIDVPVGRLPWNRKRFGVVPGGRNAKTSYEIKAYFKKGNEEYTLVELFPKTGRTHQIRVHLKYLKHSIVSDELYAGRKTSRADRGWCPRLFLHASSLSIINPTTKKKVEYDSALPSDLKQALDKLAKLS
jgi:23S rRNA pseudouridine1911/1915/1917 synthase